VIDEQDLMRMAEDTQPSLEIEFEEEDHLEEAKWLLHETLDFLEKGLVRSELSMRAFNRSKKLERWITEFLEQFE
jgi:hypothetical protein